MKTIGNIIWVVFGGLHIALEYFIAGLILMITIIGIPFGFQSMKLGVLAIWPFGSKVKWKESQPGCLSLFMNVLLGMIPFFVGDIIDIFHRANTQNMQMIQGFVDGNEAVIKQVNQRAWQSAIVLILLLLLISLTIWLLISFGSYLYSLLTSIV